MNDISGLDHNGKHIVVEWIWFTVPLCRRQITVEQQQQPALHKEADTEEHQRIILLQ
jgi:hypothetical protein